MKFDLNEALERKYFKEDVMDDANIDSSLTSYCKPEYISECDIKDNSDIADYVWGDEAALKDSNWGADDFADILDLSLDSYEGSSTISMTREANEYFEYIDYTDENSKKISDEICNQFWDFPEWSDLLKDEIRQNKDKYFEQFKSIISPILALTVKNFLEEEIGDWNVVGEVHEWYS